MKCRMRDLGYPFIAIKVYLWHKWNNETAAVTLIPELDAKIWPTSYADLFYTLIVFHNLVPPTPRSIQVWVYLTIGGVK